MADLNPVAKRLYNTSPDPVRLTLDDGTVGVFRLGQVEFFQTELRGEGVRVYEDDGALYRFTTSDDNESVIVGRQDPDEEGWELVGRVEDIEAV